MQSTLIIDGNNILHRNYHGLINSNLYDSRNRPIWAVVGSLNTISLYLKSYEVEKIIVAFDSPGGSKFRKELSEDYKATRGPSAETVGEQLSHLYLLLNEMGIPTIAMPGWEADDIIASLHHQSILLGERVILASGDRDLFQLLDENTVIIGNRNILINHEFVVNKYGVLPTEYRVLSALRGESSDNIRGVKGIGEKKASYLVSKYHSLDGILNSEDLKDAKLIQLVKDNKDLILLNLELNKMTTVLEVGSIVSRAKKPLDLNLIYKVLGSHGLFSSQNNFQKALGG